MNAPCDDTTTSFSLEGGQPRASLTRFQVDLLAEIASRGTPTRGKAVKRGLESYYDESVNDGRMYRNLKALQTAGLVEKGDPPDGRSADYQLTQLGCSVLRERVVWLQERLERLNERHNNGSPANDV